MQQDIAGAVAIEVARAVNLPVIADHPQRWGRLHSHLLQTASAIGFAINAMQLGSHNVRRMVFGKPRLEGSRKPGVRRMRSRRSPDMQASSRSRTILGPPIRGGWRARPWRR